MMAQAGRAAAIKQSIAISSVVGERVQLRRRGAYFSGCCPFHDDSTPSFWVNDQSGRFGCFGCDASGDVIDFVMQWENCDFHDAIKMLDDGYVGSSALVEIRKSEKQDQTDRIASAYKIWLNSGPIENTPAELYLQQRGLVLDELPELENLRFARLSFDRSATLHPALVAAVQTPQGEFAGIQRTYLTEDGRKLDAHSAKRSLGALKGNAIIIGYDIEIAQDCFYVCEGLEDGLSLARVFDDGPVFVAAGAGMMRFLELPSDCKKVFIGADNDEPGMRSAQEAARAFEAKGLETIVMPPHWRYKDWNEYLQAMVAAGLDPQHPYKIAG